MKNSTQGIPPAAPALEFHNVSHNYPAAHGSVTAVKEINMKVQAGEFIAIMGPSGSGKSTLLNLAGGLDYPSSGEILVFGVNLAQIARKEAAKMRRCTIGYVFQNFNLIPTLNVLENVALPLELDGIKSKTANEEALSALKEVGIGDVAQSFPSEISGGQAQRVAIARAIVGSRKLILADEPTGALDSHTSENIIALLRARADAGNAVLLVTHDTRLAAWADRVIYLRDGEIVDDTAAETPSASFKPQAESGE